MKQWKASYEHATWMFQGASEQLAAAEERERVSLKTVKALLERFGHEGECESFGCVDCLAWAHAAVALALATGPEADAEEQK